MKSTKRGKNISVVEVSNISTHGFWLFVVDREYFLPFDENPWFRDATIAQIQNVELLHGHHLHWPALDVDLELESLADPEKYPLTYQPGSVRNAQPVPAVVRESPPPYKTARRRAK